MAHLSTQKKKKKKLFLFSTRKNKNGDLISIFRKLDFIFFLQKRNENPEVKISCYVTVFIIQLRYEITFFFLPWKIGTGRKKGKEFFLCMNLERTFFFFFSV